MTNQTAEQMLDLIDKIDAALWDKHYGKGLDPAYARAASSHCRELRDIIQQEKIEP